MEELGKRQKTTQILSRSSVYVMNIEQALRLARLIMEKSLRDLGVHVERYPPPPVLTCRHSEDGDQMIVFKRGSTSITICARRLYPPLYDGGVIASE